jgi:hypothetical protein
VAKQVSKEGQQFEEAIKRVLVKKKKLQNEIL